MRRNVPFIWPILSQHAINAFPTGGDIHAQADDGASVLLEAAEGGNPDCITVLLEYGAKPNEPDNAGHLPIHRAAQEGHYL